MGKHHIAGFVALLGALAWLPGGLQANDSNPAEIRHVSKVGDFSPQTYFTLKVGEITHSGVISDGVPVFRVGAWQVTVAFNAAKCEVSCVYRRVRGLHAGLLPPPITAIRLFPGNASRTVAVVVDPAGSNTPGASAGNCGSGIQSCLEGRRRTDAQRVWQVSSADNVTIQLSWIASPAAFASAKPLFLPLRI